MNALSVGGRPTKDAFPGGLETAPRVAYAASNEEERRRMMYGPGKCIAEASPYLRRWSMLIPAAMYVTFFKKRRTSIDD